MRLVGAGVALAALLLAVADLLADGGASSHARSHAAIALGVLIAAGAILWVRPVGGPAGRALVIAFMLVAAGQLIEGVGALGYAADNDTRHSDLALAHDVGSMVAPVALLSLAVAVGIAAAARIAPRSRPAAIARGAVFVGASVAGVVMVAVLSGLL
jgi:hypothetical protein